ncbi:t-SNARE [Thamnidium elegans]|nr:t-SNARE [Thamnidium elegans]
MSYSFSRDRTAELRGSANNNGDAQPHDWGYTPNESYEMAQQSRYTENNPATTAGFFDQIDHLKGDIDSINYSIDLIANLHNDALASFNEQQSKQTAMELERIKSDTQKKNLMIKARIQELEQQNARLPNNDNDAQMRRSQTAAIRKRFLDTIQRYQDVERNYQLKYRQRIERQIRIVKPDASQDEVDDIIDSDGPPQVFAQSLMSASRQNQSKAVLSEVQTRHTDIKHIEKTIIELHQLFMDMQMMIEQQGEVLNNVEQHADTTAVQLKEGNTYLTRAIATAKSTRAKKWCCFFLCIGICVMIAILVWWFGFGHVGVGGNDSGNNNNNNQNPEPTATPQ